MSVGSRDRFLDALRSFIGTVEGPRQNETWIGAEYGWNGVAWCAIAQSAAAYRAGFEWFHTAWVPTIEAWAKAGEHGMHWEESDARPVGGMAIWDWDGDGRGDHVSALEVARGDGSILTLGGNEREPGGQREGFWRAVRSLPTVNANLRGWAVFPFEDAPAQPEPTPQPEPQPEPQPGPTGTLGGFPLPDGWYYGPEGGPERSVSGYHGHGDEVARWQGRAIELGYDLGPDGADGRYGSPGDVDPAQSYTGRAAIAVQSDRGLEVDGLIGPDTWGVL